MNPAAPLRASNGFARPRVAIIRPFAHAPEPRRAPHTATRAPRQPMMFDFEQARFNMVEQQIRTWDVLEQRVLDLLFVVRREDFVPPDYRLLAFADLEIPLGDHQKMWAPKMEARVLQELAIEQGESVLEIGT